MRAGRTRIAWTTVAAVALTGALWAPLAQGSADPRPADGADPTTTIDGSSTSTTTTTDATTTTTAASTDLSSTTTTTDGSTTTSTTTPIDAVTGVIDGAPVASMPASRMPAMQVTETLPPPTTVAPTTVSRVPGDALAIPASSGSGRRVVYSKSVMRVWMIESDGTLFHTHRVSGLESQPNPGTYAVWSRSEHTCSRSSPDICMRNMVRFAYSRRGDNIGFHEIPRRNGVPLQDLSQLGLALSGGCVRQSTTDSILMWNWAGIGTVVVVLP